MKAQDLTNQNSTPLTRIGRERVSLMRSAERLRRARWLYVRLCRGAIAMDKSGHKLQYCAERMIEAGLYAQISGFRAARYSILRKMWAFDSYRGMEWWAWTQKNGWVPIYWTRTQLRIAQRA